MPALSPQILQSMHAASSLLQAGRFRQAQELLVQVLRAEPRFVEAHRLLAGAQQALGDMPGAERSLRTAVSIDPRWAPAQLALGELLAGSGRPAEAETALRAALAAGGRQPRAAFALAQILMQGGRANEAAQLLAPLADATDADANLLTEYGNALMLVGQDTNAAIGVYERAVRAAPENGIVEYNLASALENRGRHVEALAHAQRARAKGFDVPQVAFVIGLTQLGEARFDDAETAFRDALRRDAAFADAHRELAQLIWMRTADADAATALLDAAVRTNPAAAQSLLAIKASLLASAGDAARASATIADVAGADADARTLLVAADVTVEVDPDASVAYAQRALAHVPREPVIERTLGTALLAAGRAEQAAELAAASLGARPDDQHMLAIQATAWRMLGDARYGALYDYANFVRPWIIDTPTGWPDLAAYLRDLAKSLRRLHALRTHPIGQSLRHGTQTTQNLLESTDPAIRAFFTAIDGPIRRHMAAIGTGTDPLRRRNTGRYRIKGIWSVQLQPHGFHTNHTHPEGWLSSACYIDLPDAVDKGHEGWLKLGEPGMTTRPALPPEHFVKPQPGLLALFPSYMWHGTVPFSGDKTRLTIAFDVVPD